MSYTNMMLKKYETEIDVLNGLLESERNKNKAFTNTMVRLINIIEAEVDKDGKCVFNVDSSVLQMLKDSLKLGKGDEIK